MTPAARRLVWLSRDARKRKRTVSSEVHEAHGCRWSYLSQRTAACVERMLGLSPWTRASVHALARRTSDLSGAHCGLSSSQKTVEKNCEVPTPCMQCVYRRRRDALANVASMPTHAGWRSSVVTQGPCASLQRVSAEAHGPKSHLQSRGIILFTSVRHRVLLLANAGSLVSWSDHYTTLIFLFMLIRQAVWKTA